MVNGLNETLPLRRPPIAVCCLQPDRNNPKQKSPPFGPNLGQTKRMAIPSPNILVVDDDIGLRDEVEGLITEAGGAP